MKVLGEKFMKVYTVLLTSAIAIAIFSSYSKSEEKPKNIFQKPIEEGNLPQVITSVDLNKNFDFAGEQLPMDNFDVRERLERELLVNSYWHSTTLLHIKSMYRYYPEISRILKENEVPNDFFYLAVAESSLRNETSPAGAKGFWQFMRPTGQYFGLEISGEVDERFNMEKATKAACDYIKDYKRQFGTWTMAAAAYNMGGPNLKEAIQEQKEENYYDLNLNAESNRYLFRIVALKEILSNPKEFGFVLSDEDTYQPLGYDIVKVNGPIESLADFAKKYGTTYRMLKLFNPWLLSHKLTNAPRKEYEIKVPK